jgi:hypothetical protein
MKSNALLSWFTTGFQNLFPGVLPLNKVTERFIHLHRQELSGIADKNANEVGRKKAILKRVGAAFLGGTIIRHLFKWGKKKKVVPLHISQHAFQTVRPLCLRLPPKEKKSPKKKASPTQMLIIKFPFGKEKSPKKSPKKTPKLIVKVPFAKLKNPVTPVKKTKTLADFKLGSAEKKMERAMQGPIGSFRTSVTALPSFSQPDSFYSFSRIETHIKS